MSYMNHTFAQAKSRPVWLRVAEGLGRVLGAAGRVHSALRGRRLVRGMLTLDDRMLADIGLSRMDIEGALTSRWQDDPSEVLARKRFHRAAFRGGRFSAL